MPAAYELSVVVCADALAERMNREYRNKTYTPNVLAFPLSPTQGEIFLNVRKAQREARTLGVSERACITHLFIHALLHLKGHRHGVTMSREESTLLKQFNINPKGLVN